MNNIQTLQEAEFTAIELSKKQWNSYFHVQQSGDGTYFLTKYFEDGAISYALKGKLKNH